MRLGFPFRSYGHSFLYAQCPQTMPFIIWIDIKLSLFPFFRHLVLPCTSSEITAMADPSPSWVLSFPQEAAHLGWEAWGLGPVHHFSDMLFTHLWSPGLTLVCSALCSLRLVLFDGESWSEWGRIKSLFAQCHSGTSFLVSDSLGKQFCSIAPWYLFSVGKPELCQTLRKPVMLMKVICSHPPSSVLAPTSPQLGPLHLVPSLYGFSVLPLGILPSTHSN